MRNFFYFKHFAVLMLLGSTLALHAQGFIMEHNRALPADLKSNLKFERENFTNVLNENGNKVYVSHPSTGSLSNSTNSTEGEDDVNNVNFTIDFVLDPDNPQLPWAVSIYNESGFFQNVILPTTNSVTFNVPPGTYDVLADFAALETTSHIVIKELIEVSGDTTLELIAEEADNYISIQPYDENGEVLEGGGVNPETGIASFVNFTRMIRFVESNNIASTYIFNLGEHAGDVPLWNFYINDVSDRYGISNTIMGIRFGENNYINKFETLEGVSESVDLANDPSDWSLHVEKFQPTPLSGPEVYNAYSNIITYDGKAMVGNDFVSNAFVLDPEEGFRVYLNNPINDDPVNYLFLPSMTDYYGLADPTWFEEAFIIKGSPVFSGENNTVYYGSGNVSFGYYFLGSYYYFDGEGFSILPLNPKFTFPAANSPNVKLGDNTPIAVTMLKVLPNESNIFNAQYKGNYGEIRESDFFSTTVEIKQGGNTFYTGNYIDFIWEYGQFSNGLPTSGEIELSLTNTNLEIEGMQGKNITTISYNASEADTPPALQALQFRTSSDEVTTRFQSAADATVRIAAADFNLTLNEANNPYYAYNEGNNVDFYYSPYNQNTWTEIELTKYPEHFFMPAFGDYYEASLANVQVTTENSWFDVKIVCTDAAGNTQEQIVSPAFKINEINLGIEESNLSTFVVYPNPFTNELNIQLPESVKGNYIFKATDLSGKLIHSQNRNADFSKAFIWNGASLPKGTYILSIENNGKTIAKKVIKN